MGAEHPRLHGRPLQMVPIGCAQTTEIASRHGIDAGGTKLGTHFRGDVLVEIEAEVAHPVAQRPWAASRWRQSSACSALARISASTEALWRK